ncbi:MAG: hypothetical protein K2X43_23205 [Hyphomonadaceae bacterium]|nr:hypothetical protein [Hyphomonadaceae bacterium]
MVFAMVVVIGLLYVRLMHGPIALNFLAHTFEHGMAEEFPGTGVHVETVALRLNNSGLLQFELGNVRVTDTSGEPLVMAPSVAISLSRKALLRGRIAVESLDLVSARLTLFYSDEGALSLKFSHAPAAPVPPAGTSPVLRGMVDAGQSAAAAPPHADWTLGRIDLVKALSEASARARRRENAGAYLREIGLRAATVIIDNGTRKSIWRVPEFDLDLDHRRSRSSLAGRAKIDSLTGPWELNFRTFEHVNAKAMNLAVSVQGLVPRGLARSFPQLVGLEGLDVQLWADAQLEVASNGEILAGKIVVDSAPGKVAVPWLAATPMRIDGAHVELSYSGASRQFQIAPSVLTWGESRLEFTGSIAHAALGAEGSGWRFDVKSTQGWLAGEPPDLQKLPIDQLALRGSLAPERGRIVLSQFLVKAGGAELSAQGDVSDVAGAVKGQLDAKIGPMPAATFKRLWPSWAAPATRAWVSRRLLRGNLLAGHFRVVHGTEAGWTPLGAGDRVSLALEGANIELAVVDGWPALEIPRGLLRVEGRAVEFSAPDASMTAADGRKLSLKGSLAVNLDEPLPRTGHLALKGQGPLTMAFEMLDQSTLHALKSAGLATAGVDGKLDVNLSVKLPLTPQLQIRDAVAEGKVRVSDGKVRNALGSLDAHGINLTIDLSATAADGKAEFLLKGVPARASWQHVFGVPADKQPPLRMTTTLDNNERTQLGLDINDIVQGEVGVEVAVAHDAHGERDVHVRADLVNAELVLESLAWHKPKGRPTLFEFDLAKGSAYPIELRHVKLVGDGVAIAGWMGAAADHHIKEFRFPQFSINFVTSLEAHGKLRSDNVWDVTAKGPTYDGKELFQSFFDISLVPDRNKARPGLDLRAEIDTVVGFYDTSLRGVRVSMQKRAGKMTQLDARGMLSGHKPFEASLRPEPGRPRLLNAKSADAGQVFKLIGFYPHAVGGDMNLDVNLDGQGVAERTGTLTATRFHVLGDAISVQTLPGNDGAARRNVVRERFEFNALRAPFSVGHGQFVLHNASIDGPLVSATMFGKLDFRTRMLQVGGTFTPLSTLNKLFSDVPLVGDIVTGPKREGVFAMTYALKGGLENPELVVNPFSAITPGITRELMQITPSDPRIVPRKPPSGKNDKGARSSSSPALGPQPKDSPFDGGGWSSDASPSEAKR